MGQIVIEIPNNKKRRYVLMDAKRAEQLLAALEASAVRVKNEELSEEEIEEIHDASDAAKAIAEFHRTGKTYSWQEVKSELGL